MHSQRTQKFDQNNYTFNPESKYGIYIIHGFSSTTYEVKKIAQHLSDYGYYVQADNLPGHGTSIDDCNLATYHEWLSFVEQGVASMYAKCSKVIVLGVSMGGVLALHLGTIFPLTGIVSAASLFKFKNEFNVRVLARLFHRFKKHIPKNSTFQPDQLKKINNEFYGYTHYPLSALNQMRQMVDKIKLRLHKISAPTLLIHSKSDQTAIFENYNLIRKHLKVKKLESLILSNTNHNIFDTSGTEKKQIFDTVSHFIEQLFINE